MNEISMLEPKEVFRYFKEISDVPRASRQNEKISDYLVAFAKAQGLTYDQDESGNVIIYKGATPGYEEAEPVMIQGHMDMVAVKTEDSTHDFENDPLTLVVDGDWLKADRTTLGADNGIAVAMALAVLEAEDIPHPALEVVITVDEEIGMLGADALDGSKLNARRIINIDSEDEGVITVGCAGAVDLDARLPIARKTVRGVRYRYAVDGLLGGHSGNEIDRERANAANLTGRVLLDAAEKAKIHLVSLSGGNATNVIMNKIEGELIVAAEDQAAFERQIAETFAVVKAEYRTSDPGLNILVTSEGEGEAAALDEGSLDRVLRYLDAVPSGVQYKSVELENLVETSLSMGVVRLEEGELHTRSMLRSSVNSRKMELCRKVRIFVELLGGSVSLSGEYGAWEFDNKSQLLDISVRVFEEQYGRKPEVGAIHAGVECGKWAEKLGRIDAVSIGPDLKEVHSVNEKLSLSSTARTWEYVKRILAACR